MNELVDYESTVRGCKALLVEILRRAAHDWVLYRSSRRLSRKRLAEDAYRWLFVESQSSLAGLERQRSHKELTSFVAICETLDLDPELVRQRIKLLREEDVVTSGRPATRRKTTQNVEDSGDTSALYQLHLLRPTRSEEGYRASPTPLNGWPTRYGK